MSLLVFPIDFASPEYEESLDLRYRILRAPLNMHFEMTDISDEYRMFHFGIYNEDKLAGCFVLNDQGDGVIKMRQVAVEPKFQNSGLGTLMVKYCEVWSRLQNYSQIVLHARTTAVKFYLKNNYVIEGEEFEEVGIPHRKMKKDLL